MTRSQVLPAPISDDWQWQQRGLCRGVDSSYFFHPDGERGRARTRREERAKELCRRCPVVQECLTHALTVREPYGIWGGMSESERTTVLKQRAAMPVAG